MFYFLTNIANVDGTCVHCKTFYAYVTLFFQGGILSFGWENKIYFDPEADNSKATRFDNIREETLKAELRKYVGVNEAFSNVWAYNAILSKQSTFFHMVIILQSANWFWSIEKHPDGICIQRARTFIAVKDNFKHQARRALMHLSQQDECESTVYDLIDWLHKSKELRKPYGYLINDCDEFCKNVYNFVSKTNAIL